jgi:hypothetical protein
MLVVIALAGCGEGDNSGNADLRELAKLELSAIELRISSEIVGASKDGISSLPEATDRYIDALRRHQELLGDEEVERRLADTASQVQEWCPSCAATLDREREVLN